MQLLGYGLEKKTHPRPTAKKHNQNFNYPARPGLPKNPSTEAKRKNKNLSPRRPILKNNNKKSNKNTHQCK
jgi:hypothetical protein